MLLRMIPLLNKRRAKELAEMQVMFSYLERVGRATLGLGGWGFMLSWKGVGKLESDFSPLVLRCDCFVGMVLVVS